MNLKMSSAFVAVLLFFVLFISTEQQVFAKCEAALARLQEAEAALNEANSAYDEAKKAYQDSQAALDKAVQNLNAVASSLGATGSASREKIGFGRSSTNPAFFEDAAYKAAKQAWQDAKDAVSQAEGAIDQAGANRKKAQDEYDDAKSEYEKLKAEHHAEPEKVKPPGGSLPKPSKKELLIFVTPTIVSNSVEERDFNMDFAVVLTPLEDGRTKMEISTLARGRGADFRRWVPQNPVLLTPTKERVLPATTEKIYLPQVSKAAPVAPFLFAAIGSQYEADAARATASPGTPCPVSGGPEERGKVAKAVDRAGMAAGLGLLATQAKGEIEGQKSTFYLEKDTPVLGTLFRTEVKNKSKNQSVSVTTPVILKARE